MARLFLISSIVGCGIFGQLAAAQDHTQVVNGPADLVEVRVQSGRVFVAKVHSRTDIDTLWLRYGTSDTTLLRPIRWQHVQDCKQNGKLLNKQQLILLAKEQPRDPNLIHEPSRGCNSAQVVGQGEVSDAERVHRALGFDSPGTP